MDQDRKGWQQHADDISDGVSAFIKYHLRS